MMTDSKPGIVLLVGPSQSSTFLYNYLKKHFFIRAVIQEKAVSRSLLIKRRIKKLGWLTVGGQLLFQVTVPKLLQLTSRKRYQELLQEYGLDQTLIDKEKLIAVESVNDGKVIDLLLQLQPQVVVVNGTRIISRKLLEAVTCPFINTHAGITPKYRGVHGGYWAMARGDRANCGVTIHFVDQGIDTGDIIDQVLIEPHKTDNFTTYPLHQLGVALPRLKEVIEAVVAAKVATRKAGGESRLWYHPTLGQYLYNRIFKGVR